MDVTAPIVAWQQAAIVVLFIVFLGGVFGFVRWLLNWTSTIQAKQQSVWQAFVQARDTTWQEWMDTQNTASRQTMCEVTEALKELGVKIDDHDKHVEERITRAVEGVTKNPTRRKS